MDGAERGGLIDQPINRHTQGALGQGPGRGAAGRRGAQHVPHAPHRHGQVRRRGQSVSILFVASWCVSRSRAREAAFSQSGPVIVTQPVGWLASRSRTRMRRRWTSSSHLSHPNPSTRSRVIVRWGGYASRSCSGRRAWTSSSAGTSSSAAPPPTPCSSPRPSSSPTGESSPIISAVRKQASPAQPSALGHPHLFHPSIHPSVGRLIPTLSTPVSSTHPPLHPTRQLPQARRPGVPEEVAAGGAGQRRPLRPRGHGALLGGHLRAAAAGRRQVVVATRGGVGGVLMWGAGGGLDPRVLS